MKTRKLTTVSLALASIGLAGIVCSPMAFGQDQQAPPPPQDQQGPPPPQGGGPGGFGGGPRGQFGGGGFGGRAPFAMGTVTAVDPTAKTITITPQFGGGGSQTIQVADTAKVVTQAAATVADLKTGDQVQVQGIPTGITASSLTIGENPLGGRPGGQGGFGGGGGGQARPGGPGGQGGQAAFASATGTVTATSPLTISLSSGVSLVLKMDANAKVTKFSPVALSSIKVGDRVTSMGQAGDNGTFTASTVGVNVQMGGGPGGFGGRGGFGPGGRGGNGPRGGQFQGGAPPPPAPNGQD